MRVQNRRNNLFRTLVDLTIFGFAWVIYESLPIGQFQKVVKLDSRFREQQPGPLKVPSWAVCRPPGDG